MRLGEEATFEAIHADGGGFLAHLVLARAKVDDEVLRLGEAICLEGIRGRHVALFSSSIHMTKLLTLVAERNPQFVVQHYATGEIALPMLRRGDRAKWSFFFVRAVRELLQGLIMAYIKCSMVGMAREMIERLFEAEDSPRLPRRVLSSLLRQLITDNAGCLYDLQDLVGDVDLDHENDLLIWALTHETRIKEYLETYRDFFCYEKAEITLSVSNFIKGSPKSHIVADFASICEGYVLSSDGEANEPGKDYPRTILLLKSHLLADSQRMPQILKTYLVILAEDRDAMDDVPWNNLFGVVMHTAQKAITSQKEWPRWAFSIGCPQDHWNIREMWNAFTKLVAVTLGAEEIAKKNRAMTVMVLFLRSVAAGYSSEITFAAASEQLLPTWNPTSSWEVADSLLEVIAAAVESFNCADMDVNQKSRLQNMTESALRSTHLYVRSSAFKLLGALCVTNVVEDEEFITNAFITTMTEDEEAIVRREAVKFFLRCYLGKEGPRPPSQLLRVMSEAVRDLDWEVREIALEYWEDECERGGEDFAGHMEDSWCATALARAMEEKEVRFRGKLTLVLNKIRSKMNGSEGDKNGEASISSPPANSSKVTFDAFKSMLSRYEVVDPEKSLDEHCEVHQGLWSVVDDIVQSVEPSNELDGIDCF